MRSTTLAILATLLMTGCSNDPVNNPPDNGEQSDNAVTNGEPGEAIVFENLRVEELGPRRAVIRFETLTPTTCEAEWGESEDALDQTATDPNMAPGELSTTHEVPLEDLEPETVYFWRARAVDEDGELGFSPVDSFTTTAEADPPLNNEPPLQNFAVDADVTAVSSNFGGGDNDSSFGANNAFDGQMSTEWATDGDGDDAMVTVDFGSVRKVTHVAFRSRQMSDGSSIIEEVQFRFDDGEAVGPFATPDPDERYVFPLQTAQAAERVTVEAVTTTGGNTGAREIEFLGTPKE